MESVQSVIENSLSRLDLTVPEFDGILITHEHTDHIKGLGVIARRYGLPIFATGKTIDAIFDYKNLGKVDKSLFIRLKQTNHLRSEI